MLFSRLLRINLLAAALGLPVFAQAQLGCTDSQASNFNASAIENDGSCVYPLTNYFPPVKADLADTLAEISGLVQAGGRWWAHNDSGNDDTFFRFNPETGAVNQYIKLKQANNEDWEDITTDGDNLYIGDFGNNASGNRTDLGIYRVPLFQIGNGTTTSVDNDEYTFIPFAYADQTNFDPVSDEDDIVFDCEAMIYHDDAVHLFSKNWSQKTCAHYRLNETTGRAENLETLNVDGLITSAAMSPDKKLVVLLGYNKAPVPNVFAWLLWDFRDGLFFNGNKRRLEFGSPVVFGKSEAIAFAGNRTGYIANEFLELGGIVIVRQQTRTFDFSAFVPGMSGTESEPDFVAPLFRVFPNPFSQSVHFQFLENKQPDFFRIKNGLGQVVFEQKTIPKTLQTDHWPPGPYFFEATFRDKTHSFAGFKN